MTRLEGMERTEIPEIVIHKLLQKFNSKNINPLTDPDKVTYTRVRSYLQDLGYSHLFKSIMKIISLLTDRHPVTFSDDQRNTLISRFQRIQKPFEKYKGSRKNFLSYSYVTFKFCEQLGYDEFLDYLPLLKAPQNLIAADRIWKRICKDCGFEYIATDPIKGSFFSQLDK